MSYSISVGSGGYVGWRILSNTAEQQKAIVAAQPQVARNIEHFRNNISDIRNAEDLIKDYRLLSVALKAHGLEDDIGSHAFIRKILESDLSDPKSLANRLTDQRYKDLAHSFNFTPGQPPAEVDSNLSTKISTAYIQAEFELQVGKNDNDMRIALYAQRKLAEISKSDVSDNTKWYQILSSPPLTQFIQKALGFGPSLGGIPIDNQIKTLKSAAQRQFGTTEITEIANPKKMERAIALYLVRAQLDASNQGTNRFSNALTLLRASGPTR